MLFSQMKNKAKSPHANTILCLLCGRLYIETTFVIKKKKKEHHRWSQALNVITRNNNSTDLTHWTLNQRRAHFMGRIIIWDSDNRCISFPPRGPSDSSAQFRNQGRGVFKDKRLDETVENAFCWYHISDLYWLKNISGNGINTKVGWLCCPVANCWPEATYPTHHFYTAGIDSVQASFLLFSFMYLYFTSVFIFLTPFLLLIPKFWHKYLNCHLTFSKTGL